jgi:hypothetical protein
MTKLASLPWQNDSGPPPRRHRAKLKSNKSSSNSPKSVETIPVHAAAEKNTKNAAERTRKIHHKQTQIFNGRLIKNRKPNVQNKDSYTVGFFIVTISLKTKSSEITAAKPMI